MGTDVYVDRDETTSDLQQKIIALRAQLSIYEQILDTIPDLILYKGPGSHIRYANRAFREYYGMNEQQLQDVIDAEFNQPSYTEQYVRDDAQVFETGQPLLVSSEPVTRHNGEVHLFSTIKHPIRNQTGEIVGTVGISHDLSSDVAASAALTENEARLQRIIGNVPGMVYQFLLEPDHTMHFPFVSTGSRDIYGLEPEAIMRDASVVTEAVNPSDRIRFQEAIMESARTLEPWRWEGRVYIDGQENWLQGASRPTRLINGAILWDGLLLNITEQKQAEALLGRFDTILSSTNDIVAIADLSGKMQYLNPAARRLLAIEPTDAANQLTWHDLHPDKSEQKWLAQTLHHAQVHGSWMGEHELKPAHGQRLPVMYQMLCHYDVDQQPSFFSVIAHDISDQKQAEAERQRLHEEIIRTQQQALIELSTPLIPIADTVVLLPLVGSVDTARAQQFMETLLEGVHINKAQIAIVDVTGVPVMDTQVAGLLIRAANSVQLLGARVIITGIRPELAQTLVTLGIDFRSIMTHSSLQQGITYAINVTRGQQLNVRHRGN
ncbi:PAS domain S-box protein [Herpetosiphon llansteffanensis]|uniref:PAS domain S-box protein n=1 Tax=Herpetosiphon llansteffanensis TaxID=2094568 RepID=UPI000D7CAA98|nr:PAS domain S-box protein [Herpetosiphon llansteffanensis]